MNPKVLISKRGKPPITGTQDAPIPKAPTSSHESSDKNSSSPKRHAPPRRFLHPKVPRGWTFPTYPITYPGYVDLESQPTNIHHHHDMRFRTCQTISPSYLFNVRCLQVVLAVIYLILLCYCGVHRGWWLNLQQPLGFGSACSPSPHHACITPFQLSITLFGGLWSTFYCYLRIAQR